MTETSTHMYGSHREYRPPAENRYSSPLMSNAFGSRIIEQQ